MRSIIIFDGECSFCNNSVQFIIKRDKNSHFLFTSSQEHAGKVIAEQYNISTVDSLVFIDGNHYYIKSTAALKICQHLKGAWKLCTLFLLIPRPVRDLCYDVIAKLRYSISGRHVHCLRPSKEIKKRFIL